MGCAIQTVIRLSRPRQHVLAPGHCTQSRMCCQHCMCCATHAVSKPSRQVLGGWARVEETVQGRGQQQESGGRGKMTRGTAQTGMNTCVRLEFGMQPNPLAVLCETRPIEGFYSIFCEVSHLLAKLPLKLRPLSTERAERRRRTRRHCVPFVTMRSDAFAPLL